MMQRRHYKLVAAAFERVADNPTKNLIVGILCQHLKADNYRFESERFIYACLHNKPPKPVKARIRKPKPATGKAEYAALVRAGRQLGDA